MRTARKLGLCVLTLIVFALPAMACLMPGAAMSAAEHACCKHMAEECGSASMSKSHPCCQRVTTSDRFGAAQIKSKYLADSHAPVVLPHVAYFDEYLKPPDVSAIRVLTGTHGPPVSPPFALPILRI